MRLVHCSMIDANAFCLTLRSARRRRICSCQEGSAIVEKPIETLGLGLGYADIGNLRLIFPRYSKLKVKRTFLLLNHGRCEQLLRVLLCVSRVYTPLSPADPFSPQSVHEDLNSTNPCF